MQSSTSVPPRAKLALGVAVVLTLTGVLGDVLLAALGVQGGARAMGSKQWALVLAGGALAAGAFACSRGLRGAAGAAWRAAPAAGVAAGLLLGWWLGLGTGVIELVGMAYRKFWLGELVFQPLMVLWMAPLSYGLLMAGAGAMLGLTARLSRVGRLPVVVAPLVTLGAWSQLSTAGALHPAVVLVLSLGLGWQLGRPAIGRRVLAWARRSVAWCTAAWLVPTLVVLALGSMAKPRRGEQPPAAAADNVVLVVLDTVRADRLGAYGYPRPTTPAIDALARRGTLFERAFSTSPWTLPAHASMFTGRSPARLAADWKAPLGRRHPTLAEAFAARGYRTGGFVGNLAYCGADTGLARGFEHYEAHHVTLGTLAYATNLGRRLLVALGYHGHHDLVRNDADVVAGGFLEWLDGEPGRPFFAFLNFFDAHNYYLAPPPYSHQFGEPSPVVRRSLSLQRTWEQGDLEAIGAAYDGCLAFIDSQIRRIEVGLEQRGLLDSTLIVITGDHGEQFFEHGLMGHGNSLYRSNLHVPLVLVRPGGVPVGLRVGVETSTRDVGATVLALTAAAGDSESFSGASLAAHWLPGADVARGSPVYAEVNQTINMPQWLPASQGDLYSLIEDGYQYIEHAGGEQLLFDLAQPADSERDLSDTAAGAARSARLARALAPLRAPR